MKKIFKFIVASIDIVYLRYAYWRFVLPPHTSVPFVPRAHFTPRGILNLTPYRYGSIILLHHCVMGTPAVYSRWVCCCSDIKHQGTPSCASSGPSPYSPSILPASGWNIRCQTVYFCPGHRAAGLTEPRSGPKDEGRYKPPSKSPDRLGGPPPVFHACQYLFFLIPLSSFYTENTTARWSSPMWPVAVRDITGKPLTECGRHGYFTGMFPDFSFRVMSVRDSSYGRRSSDSHPKSKNTRSSFHAS